MTDGGDLVLEHGHKSTSRQAVEASGHVALRGLAARQASKQDEIEIEKKAAVSPSRVDRA